VRATLVVARGSAIYVLAGPGGAREFPLAPDGRAPARGPGAPGPDRLPRALVQTLRQVDPTAPLVACGDQLYDALTAELRRPVRRADPAAWHEALRAVPLPDPAPERAYLLARARAQLEAALRSPAEVLVSLAREEERLARAIHREERAAEAFIAVPGTSLAEYASASRRARAQLAEHHRELERLLEAEADRTLPNLSALVGARTAARLAAAASGPGPLSRMSASRLQLLGSRRRPSPERGPRYGVVYLAAGADEVPADRRAAFARSVAALAAIAVRADVLTHGDVAAELVRRRDARRDQLRRRRR